jgi:hypothetical protein
MLCGQIAICTCDYKIIRHVNLFSDLVKCSAHILPIFGRRSITPLNNSLTSPFVDVRNFYMTWMQLPNPQNSEN